MGWSCQAKPPWPVACAVWAVVAPVYSVASSTVLRQAPLLSLDQVPIRTEGRHIVDSSGARVKWACAAWYGAESKTLVAGGLEVRKMQNIADRIRELGFNCVRLPYSLQGYMSNPVVSEQAVAANPEFNSSRWRDVFDATVRSLTSVGLMVILDSHLSRAGWCCHMSQPEGFWHVPGYSEVDWLATLGNITLRYRSNGLVVAHELRNEPHAYKGQHMSWGTGAPERDWAAAATRAGNRVLQANPEILVVVDALCFGVDLRGVWEHPVVLEHPKQVVYATHTYLEFHVWSYVDQHIISWSTVRMLSMIVAVAAAGVLLMWRRPQQPPCVVASAVGCWGAGAVLVLVVALFCTYRAGRFFCAFSSDRDLFPLLLIFLCCFGAVAACAALCCLFARRGGTAGGGSGEPQQLDREPMDDLHAGGDDGTSSEDGRAVKLPRTRSRLSVFAASTVTVVLCIFAHLSAYILESYWMQAWYFDRIWGFVLEDGPRHQATPVWMGEFGVQFCGSYCHHIFRYLYERDIDFSYWAINGRKWSEGYIKMSGAFVTYDEPLWEDETFGILEDDYETVRDDWRLYYLQRMMQPANAESAE